MPSHYQKKTAFLIKALTELSGYLRSVKKERFALNAATFALIFVSEYNKRMTF